MTAKTCGLCPKGPVTAEYGGIQVCHAHDILIRAIVDDAKQRAALFASRFHTPAHHAHTEAQSVKAAP